MNAIAREIMGAISDTTENNRANGTWFIVVLNDNYYRYGQERQSTGLCLF